MPPQSTSGLSVAPRLQVAIKIALQSNFSLVLSLYKTQGDLISIALLQAVINNLQNYHAVILITIMSLLVLVVGISENLSLQT